MAKPGAGKRKMQAQRKKQWNSTVKSLKSTGRALRGRGNKKKGCYVATCVYGSYDCPQVWTLRRFRDETLERSWFGRLFVSVYYAVSPIFVNIFGNSKTVTCHFRSILDCIVYKLNRNGVEDTPYCDK